LECGSPNYDSFYGYDDNNATARAYAEDFMDYVSKIARWTFHNEPFMKQMEERLEQTESNTLAHMAMLVL